MTNRTLGRAWAALLFSLCAVTAARPFTEADVFWHLSLGRAVLRAHARVVPDPSALPSFGRPCTVQEWLWDVSTYLVHRATGWTGLGVLVCALAALSGWAVLRSLASRSPDADGVCPPATAPPASVGAVAVVSSLVMVGALTRIRERPEAVAMVLLPLSMALARRVVRAVNPAEHRGAVAALVALEVVWAQMHPSFVLLPAVFAAVAGEDLVNHPTRDRMRVHGVTAAALGVGLFTSAFGLRVFQNLAAHSHGDAVQHIEDMSRPPWSMFNPLHLEPALAWPVLLGLGVTGMAVARRVPWAALALAALGSALTLAARRGIGPGAILTGPFAYEGALALAALVPARRGTALALVGVALGGLVLAHTVLQAGPGIDPPGRLGLRPGWYPEEAAAVLHHAPRGTRVLTTYISGPPLGFWLDGQVRTYVDSRTPLYFDDTEYAVARQVWGDAGALARAVDRYDFTAAVVERDGRACVLLQADPGWYPVTVEAHMTLFLRQGAGFVGRPVTRLAPCGLDYLTPAACGTDHGASLAADLRARDPGLAAPFTRYVLAETLTRCRPPTSSPQAALALVPPAEDSVVFAVQRDTLEASLDVATGQVDTAVDLVRRMVAEGDIAAPRVVLPALSARRDWAGIRAVLEPVAAATGDLVAPDVEGTLARVCAAQGDVACARFRGLRAAALGDPGAVPALCWFSARTDVPQAQRTDARMWLATLGRQHPGDPRFACHTH